MTDERRTTPGIGHDGTLVHRFTYHPPEPEQVPVYETVRDLAYLLAVLVESTSPPSREQSLAVTHIEETVFWANAGIARRGLSGAAYAGVGDLIEAAIQAYLRDRPDTHLAAVLSDTVPPDDAADADAAADPGDDLAVADPWSRPRTTDDLDADHPAAWGAVCPMCPAYTDTSDYASGRQRAAQEWLADHLRVVHGVEVRRG